MGEPDEGPGEGFDREGESRQEQHGYGDAADDLQGALALAHPASQRDADARNRQGVQSTEDHRPAEISCAGQIVQPEHEADPEQDRGVHQQPESAEHAGKGRGRQTSFRRQRPTSAFDPASDHNADGDDQQLVHDQAHRGRHHVAVVALDRIEEGLLDEGRALVRETQHRRRRRLLAHQPRGERRRRRLGDYRRGILEDRAVDDDIAPVTHDGHSGRRSAEHVPIEIPRQGDDAADLPG